MSTAAPIPRFSFIRHSVYAMFDLGLTRASAPMSGTPLATPNQGCTSRMQQTPDHPSQRQTKGSTMKRESTVAGLEGTAS
jgi:hypothetical protein